MNRLPRDDPESLSSVYPGLVAGIEDNGVVVAMTDLEMELRADESAPRTSRARLDEIASDLGSRLLDVKLIVSELVTNSVRHSNSSQRVQVRVRADDQRIRLEVVDEGPGFPPDPTRSDGLGLAIVERLADDWGVHVDGTCTVWVEMGKQVGEGANG